MVRKEEQQTIHLSDHDKEVRGEPDGPIEDFGSEEVKTFVKKVAEAAVEAEDDPTKPPTKQNLIQSLIGQYIKPTHTKKPIALTNLVVLEYCKLKNLDAGKYLTTFDDIRTLVEQKDVRHLPQ